MTRKTAIQQDQSFESGGLTPAQQLLLFGAEKAKRQAKSSREQGRLEVAQSALLDDGHDISFLHRGFCHCGMPLRRQENGTVWKRSDGHFSFTVTGSTFAAPNGDNVDVGLPFGPKARLLSVFIASEVKNPHRRPDDRTIEFGRVSQWLRDVGATPSSGRTGSIAASKEQIVRLAFANFTMTMDRGDAKTWFHSEKLIESGCLTTGDLEAFALGQYNELSWPDHVVLTHNAHQRMMTQAVPIATQRLQAISNNAAAIDFFVWLSYRLPKIPKGENVLASWSALCTQFGDAPFGSKFKQVYLESIKTALAAYPEANVDITTEGLVLRYSDPSVPRRTFIALPGGRGTPR